MFRLIICSAEAINSKIKRQIWLLIANLPLFIFYRKEQKPYCLFEQKNTETALMQSRCFIIFMLYLVFGRENSDEISHISLNGDYVLQINLVIAGYVAALFLVSCK